MIVGKRLAWLLTLIYFTSYVTRINFAAIVQAVITDTGYEKASLSIILVGLSITYGLGQIINGRLGDVFKPVNMIFCGLSVATVVNLLFPFASSSIVFMAVLWAINGFAQAMMWPPIVKILVSSSDEKMYSYSVIRVSWGSSFGTILVYLTAPLIISLLGWKAVMYASAILGAAVSVFWFIIKGRIGVSSEAVEQISESTVEQKKFKLPSVAILPLAFIALAIIFQGMLRDGVTSWMPTYLKEVFGYADEISILCTLSLAVFSIFAFTVIGEIYKRLFKNEVACAAVIFGIAVVGCVVMFVLYNLSGAVFTIFMLALITGLMHGVNLMLISYVPKRFKKYGNISTISGAVNSCTYIGSAIFTYAIAVLSEKIGWQNTVGVWAVIAALGTTCCLIAVPLWKRFINKD